MYSLVHFKFLCKLLKSLNSIACPLRKKFKIIARLFALDYTAVAVKGKVNPVKPVNHTSLVAVVTPTDRPRSVLNRRVIELFCGVVCVVTLPFWNFCWCRGFCHRTESDLFPFSLLNFTKYQIYIQCNYVSLILSVKCPIKYSCKIK